MKRDPKIDEIERLIMPTVDEAGLELVDIELKREAVGLVLRILLDGKEAVVALDEIADASRAISKILDEADVVTQKYTLEVSSPGIERPLTKPEHFKRFKGSNVAVKTDKQIDNRKNFKGRLVEAGESAFVVEIDGQRFNIEYDNVVKARLQVEIEF